MSTFLTKSASFFALFAVTALAACAGGANITPPASTLTSNAGAQAVAHTDAFVKASLQCNAVACASVNVIAPLNSAYNAMGFVYLTNSTGSQPPAMQVDTERTFVLIKMTLSLTKATCGNACAVIVSSTPLPDGTAYEPVIESPLAQSGATLTLETKGFTLVPGSYYYYLAQI